ncbi:MAG: two pore domain potassium channel family protein [Novosphingobium sp.]|nr:two pore domain potassium channel family protein [Novosphingobium sp.]
MDIALFHTFAISTGMLVLCVAIHGAGLFALDKALRSETREERRVRISPVSPRGVMFTFALVLGLIALHGVEIWAYALLFIELGAVEGLENAIYYSTMSYSTVGYNDDLIAHEWKLLGAFESIAGMILLGWSTAFFFRFLGRIEAR